MATGFIPAAASPAANLFDDDDFAAQRAFFAERPALAPTPLHRCAATARTLGVRELLVKDETRRFGLNAFKALGAGFAIEMLRQRGEVARGDVLACASEGNHGRAVAHVARQAGCRARVYMAATVAPARAEAIRGEGADVVLVNGSYDDAVRVMAADATANGWTVISDTSWAGYSEIPRLIMLGYTRMMDEDWPSAPTPTPGAAGPQSGRPDSGDRPDVVFVPAGVGGLLAAMACWCDWRWGATRPLVVAVEPLTAACVQASVRAGRPTTLSGPFETTMGGLRCGEMSPDVYPAVASLVDAFVAIEDEFAFEAMRLLAYPPGDDPAVVAAASGAAALGGLIATLRHGDLSGVRQRLALGPESRALVVVSEGATDPELVDRVLARP